MGDGLRLGLIPIGDSAGEAERVKAFAETVGGALGVTVELYTAWDYRVLVSAIERGEVDLAWLPPLSAARVVRSESCVPCAIAVRGGMTSYMTALVASASSKVKTLEDLRGVRAAWVDRDSASGYVVIRAALRDKGVSLADAFAEEFFAGS